MPLETATTISQLDANWPLGSDSATRGDDHLRLLKAVLKSQFPGAGGTGFSKPITVSEDLLNGLDATLKAIDKSIKDMFPVGSVVLRMDAVNPGTLYGGNWQLITGDASLTFGNGGAQSGTVVGSNIVAVPLPQHGHIATVHAGGAHRHNIANRDAVEVYDDANIMQGGAFLAGKNGPRDWDVGYILKGTNSEPSVGMTSADGHHTHSVDVAMSGIANAAMNVSGARIAINVWKRVS